MSDKPVAQQYGTGVCTPVSEPLVNTDNAIMFTRKAGQHLKHIEHYATNDHWAQARQDIMQHLRDAIRSLDQAGDQLLKIERMYRT